ncbi:hypothetical protein CVS40_12801 [Lucilia cuprina]|nr:hypothetical protein CVS40_12801 [Lucilia cuprina]
MAINTLIVLKSEGKCAITAKLQNVILLCHHRVKDIQNTSKSRTKRRLFAGRNPPGSASRKKRDLLSESKCGTISHVDCSRIETKPYPNEEDGPTAIRYQYTYINTCGTPI